MKKKHKDLIGIIICGVLLTIWVSFIIGGSLITKKKPINGSPIIATIMKRTNDTEKDKLFTYTLTLNYNEDGKEKTLDINRVNVLEKQSGMETVGKSINIMLTSESKEVLNYSDDDFNIGVGLISVGSLLLAITFFTGIFFMWSYFSSDKKCPELELEGVEGKD